MGEVASEKKGGVENLLNQSIYGGAGRGNYIRVPREELYERSYQKSPREGVLGEEESVWGLSIHVWKKRDSSILVPHLWGGEQEDEWHGRRKARFA